MVDHDTIMQTDKGLFNMLENIVKHFSENCRDEVIEYLYRLDMVSALYRT